MEPHVNESQLDQKEKLLLALRTVRPAQTHLLAFWDELDDAGRRELSRQIRGVDMENALGLWREMAGHEHDGDASLWAERAARAKPPPAFRLDGQGAKFTADEARRRGEQALRAGEIGVILVAGGQGSRLGFDHPKGLYPLGPVSQRPIFQILFDLLLAVGQRHATRIPLFVMTSPATHDETVDYLERVERFGVAAEDLHVFCQGVMPAVAAESGKLLLSAKGSLFLGPDGHGGLLAALSSSGCLAEARSRGIRHLYYCQVDNPLVQMCDPTLIGYHLLSESEMTTQVVAKTEPTERVGNVVSLDDRVSIIEYSDLPAPIAAQTNPDGSLRLWAGNIAVHVFDAQFLARIADRETALPFHRAIKKTPFVDDTGRLVEPSEPNAIKFERFIFDLLPHARNAIVVEAQRDDAFAPVKNADRIDDDKPNVDSPSTARAAMIAQHARWLHAAGAEIAPDVAVEINPRFAGDAAELAQKIKPGLRITTDTYFY